MSDEVDTLSAGELQPYNPGPTLQELQPIQPDSWDRTDVDEYQRPPTTQTLFGEPTQATPGQIDAMLGQLGGAFMHDFSSLGYPAYLVNAAIQFVTANATKTPYQVQRIHNFNLHSEAGDWLAESFGNMVHKLSGSPRAKQQFVTSCLQWLARASAQLNSQPVTQAQGSAPHSTEALLNKLSEADYNKVVAINDKALANTMLVLQRRWGDYTFRQNIEIAQNYLNSLPANEQKHFDQFSTGWVHMRNTPEFIIAMFDAATGAHSLPRDGAGIAREIAECERCMKTNRKQWLADSALQARYRTLLQMRG